MKPLERSAAIAKALSSHSTGLPKDFAARVAALAEAQESRRLSWNDAALFGAYVVMIAACVAGWFWLGPPASLGAGWLEPVVDAAVSQPWLFFGVAGVAIVQTLTFRRRATI